MYKQDLALQTWAKILKDFSAAVHDKEYKRIDYRTKWCKIAKPTKSVHIEIQEYDISILIDNKTEVVFAINDGTLGEFLYNTFYFKEEKSMSNCINITSSIFDEWVASDKTTANSAITSSDIAKVCDGLQSDSTSIDWNYYGTKTPYNHIDTNTLTTITDTGTVSYFDVEIATRPTFNDVKKMIKEEINNNKNEEKKEMKGFNFDFGPCTGDQVRMSMYGLAVKNAAGAYVSFNPATREIIDVDILNFDGGKYMYKMPVATKDMAVGDVIIHQRKPMFVEGFTELGGVMAVDPVAGERKEILPTKNMFGFNFVTKIVSLFNTISDNAPTPDAPFGNMLPFMLMNEGSDKIDPMMMMFMMGGKMDMSNPMMMYFMMKDNKDSDMLPLLFMMQNK